MDNIAAENGTDSRMCRKRKSTWAIEASNLSKRVINPIRRIIDTMKIEPNPDKTVIQLSIGDPTKYGNLPVASEMTEAVQKALLSGKFNGYTSSSGTPEAKAALAEHYGTPDAPVDPMHVIFANGCSGALEIAIQTLGHWGSNMLIPRPGFSLYKTLCTPNGISTKSYKLIPERSWEADLEDMEAQVDDKTVAIIVNNPSNPCGSVYSRQHLQDIIKIAERHCIPIIADEIYCKIVFNQKEFVPMSSIPSEVPIVHCGGIAKNYLCPGWRLGWIVVHDKHGLTKEVNKGFHTMTQRIIHPNMLMMGALEDILKNTPQSFFDNTSAVIQDNAHAAHDLLGRVDGLRPVMPDGAMYMLIGIEVEKFGDVKSDVEFVEKLMAEESVMCLPASCFETPNFFRITLTPPLIMVSEACRRISLFCERHATTASASGTQEATNSSV